MHRLSAVRLSLLIMLTVAVATQPSAAAVCACVDHGESGVIGESHGASQSATEVDGTTIGQTNGAMAGSGMHGMADSSIHEMADGSLHDMNTHASADDEMSSQSDCEFAGFSCGCDICGQVFALALQRVGVAQSATIAVQSIPPRYREPAQRRALRPPISA